MNKSLFRIISLSLLAIPFMSGCNNNPEVDPKPQEDTLPNVTSLKSGLSYLLLGKNYTLKASNGESYIYTDNYLGLMSEDYSRTDVYIESDEGVYRVNYTDSHIIASELLSNEKDLWAKNYYKTMFGVGKKYISSIDEKTASVDVTNKDYKIAFIQTVGFKNTDYVNVDSLSIYYQNINFVSKIVFNLKYSGVNLLYEYFDFGKSSYRVVDEYLANGGTYFTPNSDLENVRTLIKGNNFQNEVYAFTESGNGYIARELYHPHYYGLQYYSSTAITGAISLNSEEVTTGSNPHPKLYGCYYYQMSSIISSPSLISTPLYSEPDIPKYYHYPSYLRLLNEFQFFSEYTQDSFYGFDLTGHSYYLNNYVLVNDFMSNMSIDSNFPDSRADSLLIEYIGGELPIINIYFRFYNSGSYYVLPFSFSNFGSVRIVVLDRVYDEYND